MKVAAVLLDGFGTIVEIKSPTHPYRKLINEGRRQGRKPSVNDIRDLMTNKFSLEGAATYFGIKLAPARLRALDRGLQEELASIRRFADAEIAVAMLQQAGIKVAVCSNLASPYGSVIQELFPDISIYGFSYALGTMKPDPSMYLQTCMALGVQARYDFQHQGRVLMVGDSPRCDRDGPRVVGISGFLLRRSGKGDFDNLVDFARAVLVNE